MNKTIEERYYDMFVMVMAALGARFTVERRCGSATTIYLENVELLADGLLCSISCSGETLTEAINSLLRRLSEKTVVVDAYKATRRVVTFPKV